MGINNKILSQYLKDDIKEYNKLSESLVYEESYISYQKIIKNIVTLIKELNISNPLEIKILFEYLLYNGYLSNNKHFLYKNKGRVNNLYMLGADVIKGQGVCLNISDLLKKIYEEIGYTSSVITCKLLNSPTKHYYRPNINQDTFKYMPITKDSLIDKYIFNIVGGHAITIVNNDNKTYLCDATNLDFYNLKDKKDAKSLFTDLKIKLTPLYIGTLQNNNDILENMLNTQTKLTIEELKELYKKIEELYKLHIPLFNYFHSSIKNDIEIVSKTLK